MKNIGNEHRLFHTTRIINILLNQQTPYNDHKDNKTTDNGCFLLKGDNAKAKEIISSLFEIGMIGYEQKELMEKIINIESSKIKMINDIRDASIGLSALFDD